MDHNREIQNLCNQENLISLWNDGLLCDAVVTSREQDQKWAVHKVILASASPFFRILFLTNENVREEDKTYILREVSSVTLEIILHWIYTSKAELTTDNVHDVIIAADFYLMTSLVNECCQFLLSRMTLDNCIAIHRISQWVFIPYVETASFNLIVEKFEHIYKNSNEFLEIDSVEILLRYLQSDLLNVKSEESVWLSILLWINHNKEERIKHIDVLLRTIRLSQLPEEYINNEILQHPYVEDNEEFRSLAKSYITGKKLSAIRIPPALTFSLGGYVRTGTTCFVESYDCKLNCWSAVPVMQLSSGRAYAGVCVLEGHVYMIGGTNQNDFLSSCEAYNIDTKQWREIASMCQRRCYVSIVDLDGNIYAMGGNQGTRRLRSVERYNPNTDNWSLIQSMNFRRSDASAATLNGCIYIAGGFDGNSFTSTAEVYNPQTGVWTMITAMSCMRSGLSCVAYGDFIYAIGGNDGEERLNSVERYNPVTDQWTPISPMLTNRSNFGSVVSDDCILVAGGYNGQRTIAASECLNLETMTWTSVAPMMMNKSAVGLCVIQGIDNIEAFINPSRYPQEQQTLERHERHLQFDSFQMLSSGEGTDDQDSSDEDEIDNEVQIYEHNILGDDGDYDDDTDSDDYDDIGFDDLQNIDLM